MTTMTEVRLSDIIILNPVYFDTKLGIITLLPQVTQPGTYRQIYAAGIEGIYRLKDLENIWKKQVPLLEESCYQL